MEINPKHAFTKAYVNKIAGLGYLPIEVRTAYKVEVPDGDDVLLTYEYVTDPEGRVIIEEAHAVTFSNENHSQTLYFDLDEVEL